MDDLTQRTAEQLLALYRDGAASPVEVTRQVLQRIARLNPLLNAFCWVDESAAMASAQRSEQRWQAHRHQGRLRADAAKRASRHAVPVAISKGDDNGYATGPLRERVPKYLRVNGHRALLSFSRDSQ